MKQILTLVSELITMLLAGETEAGSVEVQPARDSQLNATNCRWGGSYHLPSHFTSFSDNSELCDALKNLIKIVPPKAGSVSAEGRKSLLTVKRVCPIHAEPVHFIVNHPNRKSKMYHIAMIILPRNDGFEPLKPFSKPTSHHN
jgi:hypothetical protein